MINKDNQDCQGFYEVSGYTTDEGKNVESYTRRCWKHGNGVSNTFIGQMPLGQINNTNSTVNNTENKVNEFTKFVENILKQKEVSNENIDFIKDNFIDIINNLCNSIEHLSVKKSKLPENPTLESVEELKNIDKERKQVYETTHKAIVTTNLAKSALEKSFKSVDTKDKDYHKKLYEHIHNKEKLKKISDSLMELFNISSSINKNSIFKVNKIKEDLGINNTTYDGLTGGAENINNLLSFETVQIPYTNEEEQQPDLLHGHVEKPDDYLRAINHELKALESNENNISSSRKLKEYSEIDRFKRLKELINALFYVIREENINLNEKIYEFKKEIKQNLQEYNQSTYPKRHISFSTFKSSINDIKDAYSIWKYNKKGGDYVRLLIFLKYLWIWKDTNNCLEEFYKRPDINITDKELDIKNEMRHITGLVFYTQKYGPEQARKYGYLKEKLDFYQDGDILDTFIDFENNEKGIAFGIKYKNLSKKENIEKIYEEFIKDKRKIENE